MDAKDLGGGNLRGKRQQGENRYLPVLKRWKKREGERRGWGKSFELRPCVRVHWLQFSITWFEKELILVSFGYLMARLTCSKFKEHIVVDKKKTPHYVLLALKFWKMGLSLLRLGLKPNFRLRTLKGVKNILRPTRLLRDIFVYIKSPKRYWEIFKTNLGI